MLSVVIFGLAAGFLAKRPWFDVAAIVFYTLWMIGHLLSWWTPYLTGWPRNAAAAQLRGVKFLPVRPGRPNPDVLHAILGLMSLTAWTATIAAWRSS